MSKNGIQIIIKKILISIQLNYKINRVHNYFADVIQLSILSNTLIFDTGIGKLPLRVLISDISVSTLVIRFSDPTCNRESCKYQ